MNKCKLRTSPQGKLVTFENSDKLFIKSDPEEALNVLESGKVNKSDPNWKEFKILVSFLSVVLYIV